MNNVVPHGAVFLALADADLEEGDTTKAMALVHATATDSFDESNAAGMAARVEKMERLSDRMAEEAMMVEEEEDTGRVAE